MRSKIVILATTYLCLTLVATSRLSHIEIISKHSLSTSPWIEHSDTIRPEGKSKANLVIHKTANSTSVILFTLLNPQPCGAAFAGVKQYIHLNLDQFDAIELIVRGQGQYTGYKFILRHYGEDSEKYPAFCHLFDVNLASDDFQVVTLALNNFKPFSQGKVVDDPDIVLNRSQISSVGIQGYGGVYLDRHQAGVGALEIQSITVLRT